MGYGDCLFRFRIRGRVGHVGRSGYTPAWRHLVLFAVMLGLPSCAFGPRHRAEPSAVLIEEPMPEPAHASPKRPNVTHLEGHVFSVAPEDTVAGSLGTIELRDGDALSAVARHFGLGYEEIVAANPELDPWVIGDHTIARVPLQFVLPKAPRRGIVINLAAMRLFHYPAPEAGSKVVTYPVGIGKEGRSTPTGSMAIASKKKHPTWRPTPNILNDHLKRGDPLPAVVPPGPDNPLGDYAMYLTAPRYLIHGTNKPYSIGLRASNGCIRLYPENVEQLFPTVPVREPVTIVNQPYLAGSRAGVFYLQAYQPHEEVNEAAAKQRIRNELKALEAARNQRFDWAKVDQILAEHRGIPFPISADSPSIASVLDDAVVIAHPGRFFGQPVVPPPDPSGWHVLAAETASEISARRMAGIMNHQGPPIPARVMEVGERYQVVAGPFSDQKSAQKAARRLRVDLELESRVLSPETQLAGTSLPPLAAPLVSKPVTTGPEFTFPEIPEPVASDPATLVPDTGLPSEPPPAEAVPTVETVPDGTPPAYGWPEPMPQEPAVSEPEPAPQPGFQEPAVVDIPDGALPPPMTEPASEEPPAVEHLDLTVPDRFSDPNAPPPISEPPPPEFDPTLELPPDLENPDSTRSDQTLR